MYKKSFGINMVECSGHLGFWRVFSFSIFIISLNLEEKDLNGQTLIFII